MATTYFGREKGLGASCPPTPHPLEITHAALPQIGLRLPSDKLCKGVTRHRLTLKGKAPDMGKGDGACTAHRPAPVLRAFSELAACSWGWPGC